MNKLFAYPYIKETVNQNRLTSPMSTGANATVPKVRRHYFIRGVYFLVYGLKGPLGLCRQGGAGATRPSSPKSP